MSRLSTTDTKITDWIDVPDERTLYGICEEFTSIVSSAMVFRRNYKSIFNRWARGANWKSQRKGWDVGNNRRIEDSGYWIYLYENDQKVAGWTKLRCSMHMALLAATKIGNERAKSMSEAAIRIAEAESARVSSETRAVGLRAQLAQWARYYMEYTERDSMLRLYRREMSREELLTEMQPRFLEIQRRCFQEHGDIVPSIDDFVSLERPPVSLLYYPERVVFRSLLEGFDALQFVVSMESSGWDVSIAIDVRAKRSERWFASLVGLFRSEPEGIPAAALLTELRWQEGEYGWLAALQAFFQVCRGYSVKSFDVLRLNSDLFSVLSKAKEEESNITLEPYHTHSLRVWLDGKPKRRNRREST